MALRSSVVPPSGYNRRAGYREVPLHDGADGSDNLGFPSYAEWLGWPAGRVADLVNTQGRPLVVAWPYEGTRRWYLSYRADASGGAEDYLRVLTRRQAEISRLIFGHGARALLIPLFGSALLERGRDYAVYGLSGLRLLGEDEVFRDLYASGGVRVRFYGDYRGPFERLGLTHIAEFCRNLEAETAANGGPLLLIGLFAEDPYGRLAEISVRFARERGRVPDRRELVELYYGVPVPDLSVYVGYAQHALFDVPLIATGREDLYATLNPSPALSEGQLREILYDHYVWRRLAERDYDELSAEERSTLAARVRLYEGLSLGVGRIDPATRTWAPVLPEDPLRGT